MNYSKCTFKSPRLGTDETLYWVQGDTFSWQLNLTLDTHNEELVYDDIKNDTILITFYKKEDEGLLSRSIQVKNLIAPAVQNGIITGTFPLNIVTEEQSSLDILTDNFSTGKYFYNIRYIHGNTTMTILHKRWIRVE